MLKVIKKVGGLVVVLSTLLLAVKEEQEDVEKEKQKVADKFIEIVEKYGEDNLPGIVVKLLTQKDIVNAIIDVKLWAIKRTDFLQ